MTKCKPINHRFESDGGPCLNCGKTMLEIFTEYDEKRKAREEKKARTGHKSISHNNDNYSADALDGCSSISSWEERHGRGFWGNATSGYVYDKYNQ
jgi:hypothetical protein